MLHLSLLHKRQFKSLGAFYLHAIIRYFAVSMFQIFNGIYILEIARNHGFEYHQALSVVAFILCLVYIFDALSIGPTVWLIAKKGLKFTIFWGSISLVLFYIILSLGKYDFIFLPIATIFGGMAIGLYWTAYHVYFSHLSDDKKQGAELSISAVLQAIASIGGPAFGSLIISYWGFEYLFVFLALLVMFAVIPLRYLPRQENQIEIHLLKTVMTLSPRREWKSFVAMGADSIADLVSVIFLPIFILTVMSGIIGVGFIGSLVAFFAMAVTFLIGMAIDKFGPKRVTRIFAPLDAIAWVLTTLIYAPVHVYIMSAIYAITRSGIVVSLDATIYGRARHEDLVAYIFQREIGMSAPRAAFLFILGILFWFKLPLIMVFIFAALITLLTTIYPYQTAADKQKIIIPDKITSD
jgi:MFS family permease